MSALHRIEEAKALLQNSNKGKEQIMNKKKKIGVIGAMEEEVEALEETLQESENRLN